MGGSGAQNGWILDYGAVEEDPQGYEFLWAPQLAEDPTVSSMIFGFDGSQKETKNQDNTKKRARQESCAAPGSKACREKQRRDRLNERFNELCAVLEPGKPPKADKLEILTKTTCLLSQLRTEAQKLKKSNENLQDNIKNLKVEKSSLRDEKTKLKAEKERLEQMLKSTSITPQYVPCQPVPATISYPAPVPAPNKYVAYTNYQPAAFWQWIPSASLDTTKDAVHWPPVA
ncbi:basic helix-loop-helix (bHLH) DNA-binding superfamily protein [Rhynchospora pubera]|uniref:Basic helix-loop-helix (BHLH) DNA-binding superfamily protein n=1 Tax=Rhynchospora pubera TaxID=906938 RepID=A0AAV8C6U6_9POAL|nr:basic helix-loop-helix (bHLH) DNA-binding superfamily protein [Rhynchospora pubera]